MALTSEELLAHNAKMSEIESEIENGLAKRITALSNEVYRMGYTTASAQNERNFKVLFDEWFVTFKEPNLASVTVEKMRTLAKKHIHPVFENLDVNKVDEMLLQRLINEKSKQNYSMDFIKHLKQFLNQFFEYAERKNLIVKNPMRNVIIRNNGNNYCENESKALTEETRKKIFALLQDEPLLKPIILTLTLTGIRPQELIALKWVNVDFENGTISIKGASNRTTQFDENGEVIGRSSELGNTKTKKSMRTFIAPQAVIEALQEHKTSCNSTEEFIFPNTKTGGMRTYSSLRSLLQRFIKRNKLESEKITLYTFRHTFATMLLEQRENPKIVADLMGHTKVTTTLMIYSHVINNSVYEETANKLNDLYEEMTTVNKKAV
ncbi:site-specific integrase [Clostridia bacterium]|nr:site-specific integrase [Clostridia bacterium]